MGSRMTGDAVGKVYSAAETWVDRALRSDNSLFTPGTPIWSKQSLGELHDRFLNRPDEGARDFFEKLRDQLEGSPAEVYQLMGEVLYVHYLILVRVGNKQQRIEAVLKQSRTPVEIPQELIAGLQSGFINAGPGKTHVPFQVGTLIESVEQWKEQGSNERDRLLDDPWSFKDFLFSRRFRSQLLANNQNTGDLERHVLLHIIFPDSFERILKRDKQRIAQAKAFARFLTEPNADIDRAINQIRQGMEAEKGRVFDFYEEDIVGKWKSSKRQPPPPPPPQDPWFPSNITALADKLLWEYKCLQDIVADLQEKRQVIFYGPPGTGKTYVAREIAKQCQLNGGGFEIVQFHPSYSYEDFVEGFRPKLHGGQPGFELVPGPLRRIADRARNSPDATFILVIDELNRGNVAKVFGELYFLLEYRNEEVRLQYGGGAGFSLPSNLWFICTMNTADRSIALMDGALRRRFYFAPFFPDASPIKGLLSRWLDREGQPQWVADLVDKANEQLDRDTGIGPSHFMRAGDTLDESRVRRIWDRAVLPYIEEQCFGDDAKLNTFKFDSLKRRLGSTEPGEDVTTGESAEDQGNDANLAVE